MDPAPKPFRSRQCRPAQRYRAEGCLRKRCRACRSAAGPRPNLRATDRPSRTAPRQLTVSQPVQTFPDRPPPGTRKPHFAALYAVIGSSAIFIVLLVATGFWFSRPRAIPTPSPSPSPEPAPTQEETATLEEPVPKTATTEKPAQKDDPSAPCYLPPKRPRGETTTPELLKISRERLTHLPEGGDPEEEMEMIAARLRSNAVQLTPEKFAMLQGPLEQAAKHNVLSAQMLLGEWLRKSDPQAALKWFAAAAAQGQTEAMTQAGLMMANGLGNDAPDFSAAVAWFQQEQPGDTDAMVSSLIACSTARALRKRGAGR